MTVFVRVSRGARDQRGEEGEWEVGNEGKEWVGVGVRVGEEGGGMGGEGGVQHGR